MIPHKMDKALTFNSTDWIALLNEQADEWTSIDDLSAWFSKILARTAIPNEAALQHFWDTLTLMRSIIYDLHFGRNPQLEKVNEHLLGVTFTFDKDVPGSFPPFHATLPHGATDSDLLHSLAATVLATFSHDLGRGLSPGDDFSISRCEGLYRDPRVKRLSAAPDIEDGEEINWRKEVEVLVEKGLEQSQEILRCADFFPASAKSRFCSNACRTSTFQIVKQLRDPVYLAEKQRRYREKKR